MNEKFITEMRKLDETLERIYDCFEIECEDVPREIQDCGYEVFKSIVRAWVERTNSESIEEIMEKILSS